MSVSVPNRNLQVRTRNFIEFRKNLTAKLILLAILSIGTVSIAYAQQNRGLGIGIMVGEPTGLSLKNWSRSTSAYAAGIAWSFTEKTSLHVHLDYVRHKPLFRGEFRDRIPFYYGLGARMKMRDEKDSKVGVRIPLGITMLPDNVPIDIFFEIVPVLDILPDTDFGFNSALGIRYYF